MTAKQVARAEARRRLTALTAAEREGAAGAIAESLWRVPEIAAGRLLLLYASTDQEVPTDAIALEARARGIETSYPRCLPESREMALHLLSSPDRLVAGGRYGIREPTAACRPVAIHSVDVALLPGLGWNRRGHRLGRGAGYYDRLLGRPEWRGVRVGIFFAVQEFPDLPADDWDVPLDIIVTEREIIRTSERGGVP